MTQIGVPTLLEAPNVIAAMAEVLARLDNRLRELCHRSNSRVADALPAVFGDWFDMQRWYLDLRPLAMFLNHAGFSLPQDKWHGSSTEQLQFLNEWADLLPSLKAYFDSGAPIPSVTQH